jgi:hypothetical protein
MQNLPDLSHFKVISGSLDISQLQKWPAGHIGLLALLFPVDFKAEHPVEGWKEYRLENLTPERITAQAWHLLKMQNPELNDREDTRFAFVGKLKRVIETVAFQVFGKREIRYESYETWNM